MTGPGDAAASPPVPSAGPGSGLRPNVVLVVLDTVRARNLRAYGYGRDTMPGLDRFLEQATLYRDATSTSPWTLPSHAAMFTGRMPRQHGAHELHRFLDPEIPHLAELLQGAGYETVGASCNSWISNSFGTDRGFQRFFKGWQLVQAEGDLRKVHVKDRGEKVRAMARQLGTGSVWANLANGVYQRFLADRYDSGGRRVGAWVRRWLESRDGGAGAPPFFLFVNLMEAHLRYMAPEPFRDRFVATAEDKVRIGDVNQDPWAFLTGQVEMYEEDFALLRDLYDGELVYLDTCLTALFEALEAAGQWERSLVIVTSDHGENIGEHGLMDHQYCLYDTLLRVPLAVRYPDGPRGEVVEAPVQSVDVFPTVLELAGVEMPDGPLAPGSRSLTRASAFPDRVRVAEYLGPEPHVEALEARFPGFDGSALQRSLQAVQTADGHKLVVGSDGTEALFDLGEDPAESRDATDPGDRRDALRASLESWEREAGGARETGAEPEVDDAIRRRLEHLGYL